MLGVEDPPVSCSTGESFKDFCLVSSLRSSSSKSSLRILFDLGLPTQEVPLSDPVPSLEAQQAAVSCSRVCPQPLSHSHSPSFHLPNPFTASLGRRHQNRTQGLHPCVVQGERSLLPASLTSSWPCRTASIPSVSSSPTILIAPYHGLSALLFTIPLTSGIIFKLLQEAVRILH